MYDELQLMTSQTVRREENDETFGMVVPLAMTTYMASSGLTISRMMPVYKTPLCRKRCERSLAYSSSSVCEGEETLNVPSIASLAAEDIPSLLRAHRL